MKLGEEEKEETEALKEGKTIARYGTTRPG